MFVFGVIELLILIRFLLELFAANTQSAFVQWVDQLSGIFMAPFGAIFGTQAINGATFDWSALVAIAVYALAAWLIVALIRVVTPGNSSQTVETVETQPVVARRSWWDWRRRA
jgi:uncharacterized protein YggT (Ycf19 family)